MSRKPQRLDAPPASRSVSAAWRDPRLWVGVVLVAGSVVAGSAVVGSADDSTAVWAAARDLGAGEVVKAEDLSATRIRFEEVTDADRYLLVAQTLPDDLTLQHDVGEGTLVPAAVLGSADVSESVEVSVAVDPEHVPVGVGPGSHVDVWVVAEGRGSVARAKPVLLDVRVIAAPSAAESFATTSARQLVLSVPTRDRDSLAVLLAASGEGLVRVVGRP